jgi:hypothetical protein
MSLTFQPIHKSHNRKDFDCGTAPLNQFLQETARRQEATVSSTTVMVDSDKQTEIIGFYTLVFCEIDIPTKSQLYQKYPHKLQGLRLVRLGVDIKHKGHGFGAALVVQAIKKTVQASNTAPLLGLFVDAKDMQAKSFYLHLGFIETQPGSMEMWLTFDQCKTV